MGARQGTQETQTPQSNETREPCSPEPKVHRGKGPWMETEADHGSHKAELQGKRAERGTEGAEAMRGGRQPRRFGWVGLTWQLYPAHCSPAAPLPLAEPPAASSGWGPQGHPHCRVTGQHCDCCHSITHPRSPAHGAQHLPEEGDLRAIHSRAELKGWVLAKRRHNEAEEQGQAHKEGRQHDLGGQFCQHPPPHTLPGPHPGSTTSQAPSTNIRKWVVVDCSH